MLKRLKILFGFIITFVITACSIGLSFWYFGGTNYTPEVDKQIMVDNIKENYTFGRNDNTTKIYTIYLFPSSIYADLYNTYLTNPKNSTKPEDYFGYFTVSLDDEGNKNYEVTHKSNTAYDNYYELLTSNYEDGYATHSQYYLSYDYEDVYEKSNSVTGSDGFLYKLDGLGEPNLPVLEDYSNDSNKWADIGWGNRFDYENQYRYDRFGAWGELHSYEKTIDNVKKTVEFKTDTQDLGRYLPQKITVTQSITVDEFLNYTTEPITSMGDGQGYDNNGQGYYNLQFTSWVTFGKNDNSFPYVYDSNNLKSCLAAFTAGDINNYFDIMRNLDEYADSDGVIRLFPHFSNGKNYRGEKKYSYGKRDVFRCTYKVYNADSKTESTHVKYFMYNSNVIKDAGNSYLKNTNLTNAGYAVIPNFELNSTITEVLIECGYLSNSTGYSSNAWTAGSWPGGWNEVLKLDSEQIASITKENGEGLYNLYVFIGDLEKTWGGTNYPDDYPGYGGYEEDSKANDQLFPKYDIVVKEMFKNATVSSSWPELINKKLINLSIPKPYLDYKETKNWVWDGFDSGNVYFYKYMKPLVLAYEKVSESRIYTNVNSSYQTASDYSNFINNSYNDAKSFVMTSGSIYGATQNSSNSSLDVNTNLDYSQNNPYIYIAKDVDLTNLEDASDNFQILFNQTFNSNVNFILSPTNNLPSTIVYNGEVIDGKFSYNEYNIYKKADGYFKSTTIMVCANAYKGFEVLEEGVYDFIIIYNMGNSSNVDDTNNVYVYCRRHESNFVKLFSQKSDIQIDNNSNSQNYGFAKHDETLYPDLNGKLLWKSNVAEGDVLTPSTKGGLTSGVEITISSAIETYIANKEGKEVSSLTSADKEKYYIKDYVTDKIIIYFDKTKSSWVGEFELKKNYLLYIEVIPTTNTQE